MVFSFLIEIINGIIETSQIRLFCIYDVNINFMRCLVFLFKEIIAIYK